MAYGYPTHPVQPVDPQPQAPPAQAEGEPWQVMRDRRIREFLAANPSRRAPPMGRRPVAPVDPVALPSGPNAGGGNAPRDDVELPVKPGGFVAGGDGAIRSVIPDGPNAGPQMGPVKPQQPIDKSRLLAVIGPRRYRRP